MSDAQTRQLDMSLSLVIADLDRTVFDDVQPRAFVAFTEDDLPHGETILIHPLAQRGQVIRGKILKERDLRQQLFACHQSTPTRSVSCARASSRSAVPGFWKFWGVYSTEYPARHHPPVPPVTFITFACPSRMRRLD